MDDEPNSPPPEPARPKTFDERLRNWSLLKRLLLAFCLLTASYITAAGTGLMILLMLAFSTDGCQHFPDLLGFLVFQFPIYALGIGTALPALFLACACSIRWIVGSIFFCVGLCAFWLVGGFIAIVMACQ